MVWGIVSILILREIRKTPAKAQASVLSFVEALDSVCSSATAGTELLDQSQPKAKIRYCPHPSAVKGGGSI